MIEIRRRYHLQAQAIADRLPQVLQRRGLEAPFSDFLVTETQGIVLLFATLDLAQIKRLEVYTKPELLHHLSTDLHGLPVLLSNTNGLRYVIPLSPLPRIPHKVDFPGTERGQVQLGLRYNGEILSIPWQQLGHLLVAGKTGSGKSAFLRLLVYQALAEGVQLLLSDLDGSTFPMLANHRQLLLPISTSAQGTSELVSRVLGECRHRAELYTRIAGYPENMDEYNRLAPKQGLEPIPRLLVVLDEFSALVTSQGGPNGKFANQVTELGWRGRKFGIHLVFAAQDFTKQVVGRVRDQVATVVCFRVRSAAAARLVGCPEAVRIPENRPGLAHTDRWGPLQTFYLDKQLLVQDCRATLLSQVEIQLAERSLAESAGRMSIPLLVVWGLRERRARALVEDWELRGWLQQDPQQQNARYITPMLTEILSNCQTSQAASNASS